MSKNWGTFSWLLSLEMRDCSFCAGSWWWRHEVGTVKPAKNFTEISCLRLARLLRLATDSINLREKEREREREKKWQSIGCTHGRRFACCLSKRRLFSVRTPRILWGHIGSARFYRSSCSCRHMLKQRSTTAHKIVIQYKKHSSVLALSFLENNSIT